MLATAKPCLRCGETKPLEDFYKDRGKRDGRMNICRECHRPEVLQRYRSDPEAWHERARRQYWADPEKARKRANDQHAELRDIVFGHYGRSCACCRTTARLTIDHVNGDGAQHREQLGGSQPGRLWLWLVRNGFPGGFQVLCQPCNASKGTGTSCRLMHAEQDGDDR